MKARVVRLIHYPGNVVVHIRAGWYSVLKYDTENVSLNVSDEIEGDFETRRKGGFFANGTEFSAKIVSYPLW